MMVTTTAQKLGCHISLAPFREAENANDFKCHILYIIHLQTGYFQVQQQHDMMLSTRLMIRKTVNTIRTLSRDYQN